MAVLIGYTNTSEGHAALRHGADIAEWKQEPMNVFLLKGEPGDGDVALTGALKSGARLVERDTRDPYPAADLLDTASEIGASAIVIGIRSRSRVGKFLLGSDAQEIILGAQIPVMTVKGDADAD